MTCHGRMIAGFSALGVLIFGLSFRVPETHAAAVSADVMIQNVHSAKCATIAGGTSSDNNIPGVQFQCDTDASRRWRLDEMPGGNVFQIRNVKTGKCLTIAGGTLPDNNIKAVQFDCDDDMSRRWVIIDITGSGIHQIRNAKTGKCLTFAGGTLSNDNIELVQFDCDADPSRRWTIRLKL